MAPVAERQRRARAGFVRATRRSRRGAGRRRPPRLLLTVPMLAADRCSRIRRAACGTHRGRAPHHRLRGARLDGATHPAARRGRFRRPRKRQPRSSATATGNSRSCRPQPLVPRSARSGRSREPARPVLAMVSHENPHAADGFSECPSCCLIRRCCAASAYAKAVKTSGDTLLSLMRKFSTSPRSRPAPDLEARPVRARPDGGGTRRTALAAARMAKGSNRVIRRRAAVARASSAMPRGCARFCSISPARGEVHRTRRRHADRRARRDGRCRPLHGTRHRHGIAPDAQTRIFEEFEQADAAPRASSRHRPWPHHLAPHRRTHGRRLTLKEPPGEVGVCFHVTLARADGRSSFKRPRSHGPGILIVSPGIIEAPLIAQRLGAGVRGPVS